jgi:hypothetical protein
LSINIERASKKCRKEFKTFQKGDKEGVDNPFLTSSINCPRDIIQNIHNTQLN